MSAALTWAGSDINPPPAPKTTLPWWLIFSASQVSLWRECERKWAYRYILGIKSPQTPKQVLGDAVDSGQFQPYLTGGRPFDDSEAGQIARVALPHLPPPMLPGLACQHPISLASPSGKWAYQGYIDLWLPDSRAVANIPRYDGPPIPLVQDFKTIKSLRWMKTSEALRTDVQAQLYGTYAIAETGSDYADLNWLTITTEKPYVAKPAHLRVHIDQVWPQFEAIDATGHELHDVRMAAPPREAPHDVREAFVLSLKPNLKMCDEYGGCPHRHICNHTPQVNRDAVVAKMKERKKNAMTTASSALARLKARKPGATPAPTTAAETTAAPAATATTTAPAPAPAPAHAPTEKPLSFPLPGYDVPAEAFAGVNPPEKDLPPAPKAAPPVATTTDAAPLPNPPDVAEPKASRGRPKGSKNKPKTDDVAAAATPAPADAPAAPTKSAEQIIEEMLDDDAKGAAPVAVAAVESMVRAALAATFERIAASLRGTP